MAKKKQGKPQIAMVGVPCDHCNRMHRVAGSPCDLSLEPPGAKQPSQGGKRATGDKVSG